MNITQGLALYLTLFREAHGEGASVPFVGTPASWKNTHTDTFQDILAKQEIHLALSRDKVASGSSFNCADGNVTTWEQKWPEICSYFGLEGTGPGDKVVDVAAFAKENGST